MTQFIKPEEDYLLDTFSLPEFDAHEEGLPALPEHARRGIFSQSPDRAARWMEIASESFIEN